jgi:cell division protein ZipA
MQELRFVLIIVGALAIAALLFHGLWSSKKEGQTKFANKPLGKIASENEQEDNDHSYDDYEVIRKPSHEPDFGLSHDAGGFDPLDDARSSLGEDEMTQSTSRVTEPTSSTKKEPKMSTHSAVEHDVEDDLDIPSFTANIDENVDLEKEMPSANAECEPTSQPAKEPEMQVIVLNVHCSGSDPFIGTKLFDSMKQNGLLYGDMDIFHRHADLSGTGKVLFSVANMMQPGTLKHDDPEQFSTKGISFFMTLPGFGEAEQNFKVMLRTAQQIADDLGGNVLDDQRNLMTPDRLDAYRKQIHEFNAEMA